MAQGTRGTPALTLEAEEWVGLTATNQVSLVRREKKGMGRGGQEEGGGEARQKVRLRTRAEGVGAELEGAEAPEPSPLSTGWGRVAPSPFQASRHSPFLAWVAEAGVLPLTVTGCPLDTYLVTESLLDAGSPGGAGAAPLGIEYNPAQSQVLGSPSLGPCSDNQSPPNSETEGYRPECSIYPGGTPTDSSLGWKKSSALVSWSREPLWGPSASLLYLRNPSQPLSVLVGVSGPSLTCRCWLGQHSQGHSQGQGLRCGRGPRA